MTSNEYCLWLSVFVFESCAVSESMSCDVMTMSGFASKDCDEDSSAIYLSVKECVTSDWRESESRNNVRIEGVIGVLMSVL